MSYKSDIEIARESKIEPIEVIAKKLNIEEKFLERYGQFKAKIAPEFYESLKDKKDGKLILVTAITPTPAGEGKTTTSVGLADSLARIGKNTAVVLREPSLGPVFGVKGGAAGGGYAQVIPMEDINLHFTGDIHAITAANNLLAAIVDNHIYQGNELLIDTENIVWKRCLDINDRQLRFVDDGLGSRFDGVKRRDGFDITAASEIMATLCLAENLEDLKLRLSNIVVGYTEDNVPVKVSQLGAENALAILLKDAIKPNLVQTLEGTPAIIHGGPFANIAHGCNTLIATKTALKAVDYVVTEAGFGADLGAEKFLDIKCRTAGLEPSAVVVVATIRALKHHGGAAREDLAKEDLKALELGLPNLLQHIDNIKTVFGLPIAVGLNRFPDDTEKEIEALTASCEAVGVKVILNEVWAKGSLGGTELAEEVVRLCDSDSTQLSFAYNLDDSIEQKLTDLVQKVYRADGIILSDEAKQQIERITLNNYDKLPICIAKTQYSFSDDAKKLGAPEGFMVTVRSLRVSAGAGFIVALCGRIMTMPGLPKVPAAIQMEIDKDGDISGLF
ncbi:MAG: formate--tetrahydrofolate ligase [Oscillospiraceae bacterium]|nr:formate--tetrahydrofolate ligase [Oscillospiraceae bacterium]